MIEQNQLNKTFDQVKLWIIKTSDSQIRKMRKKIEKNMYNNKNNNLKDLKIIIYKNN